MLLRSGAMIGGCGPEFEPMRLGWDDHSSEGEIDDCTFVTTRSSFSAEDSDGRVENNYYIFPPCPGKTEAARSCTGTVEVTPSPLTGMEVTPSTPGRMEITSSIPVKMKVTAPPPVEMGVTSSLNVWLDAPPPPPVRIEVTEPSSVTLTPEQQQVLDLVQGGKNVFFSGPGGTGKTVVLQEIVKFFRQRYNKSHSGIFHLRHSCECFACNVAITAPTGIAAIPIGGSTLHRATGIGIPRRLGDFNRMWDRPIRLKWRNLSVLIVDEISMVSAELLEYLEQTIRRIRTEEMNLPGEPFGGLQATFSSCNPLRSRIERPVAINFLIED
ncbi:hypothetical protein M758_8G159000 [Ceratodon purpureus]|nr:hypothetical protein M758_8G159000 [Ceratodon purpureus]